MRNTCWRQLFSAFLAVGLVLSTDAKAAEKVLHAFTGADGALPVALISDAAGNLYGVDNEAGDAASSSCAYSVGNGCGTVFELTPTSSGSWNRTVLHRFTGGSDGRGPADLEIDGAGNLYGVAQEGGTGTGCIGGHGCGTAFELTPSSGGWRFRLLHNFTGGSDGAIPGAISLDKTGSLYITAQSGGNTDCGGLGCGTIFRLVASSTGWRGGTLRIFDWTLTNQQAGNPLGKVIFDSAGNLYGVAGGGTYNDYWSATFGVVYELSPSSAGQWKENILYSFCPGMVCSDGADPEAGLVFDSAGNLYGTTTGGGIDNSGSVFELAPESGSWYESVLYSFTGGSDGATPVSPLALSAAGNIFGTTAAGGDANCTAGGPCGVVFELRRVSGAWQETVLHSFAGEYDGADPSNAGGVFFDADGNLYGTALFGGINSATCPLLCGVVYELPGVGRK